MLRILNPLKPELALPWKVFLSSVAAVVQNEDELDEFFFLGLTSKPTLIHLDLLHLVHFK